MERMNYSPFFTKYIAELNTLKNDPLCLVDVGASGGIHPYWHYFGKSLKAYGFDPLCKECERLNNETDKPDFVSYFPYFIVSDAKEDSQIDSFLTELQKRRSSIKALDIQNIDYAQKYYNQGEKPIYSDKKISLDQFFENHPTETIDFIKIDTDGFDYNVLLGSKNILSNSEVLGILIETQFHGAATPDSNTFRNIDRFLTERGFTLFDLMPYRFTRTALPGKFVYSIPAQTVSGQVFWGDALYFRDYAGNRYNKTKLSPTKIIKLACLYELFLLYDCSAELLNQYRDLLTSLIDVDECLNILVKNTGKKITYSEYIQSFETNIKSFYPKPRSLAPSLLQKSISNLKRLVKALGVVPK